MIFLSNITLHRLPQGMLTLFVAKELYSCIACLVETHNYLFFLGIVNIYFSFVTNIPIRYAPLSSLEEKKLKTQLFSKLSMPLVRAKPIWNLRNSFELKKWRDFLMRNSGGALSNLTECSRPTSHSRQSRSVFLKNFQLDFSSEKQPSSSLMGNGVDMLSTLLKPVFILNAFS